MYVQILQDDQALVLYLVVRRYGEKHLCSVIIVPLVEVLLIGSCSHMSMEPKPEGDPLICCVAKCIFD